MISAVQSAKNFKGVAVKAGQGVRQAKQFTKSIKLKDVTCAVCNDPGAHFLASQVGERQIAIPVTARDGVSRLIRKSCHDISPGQKHFI